MGICYYAVDTDEKKYFSAPGRWADKCPGIFHPTNPFPGMFVMMNMRGYDFQIWNDCGYNIPPEKGYEDVTDTVFAEYRDEFKEYFKEKTMHWISTKERQPGSEGLYMIHDAKDSYKGGLFGYWTGKIWTFPTAANSDVQFDASAAVTYWAVIEHGLDLDTD